MIIVLGNELFRYGYFQGKDKDGCSHGNEQTINSLAKTKLNRNEDK